MARRSARKNLRLSKTGPGVSFLVLIAVLVSAVVVGNLREGTPHNCWPVEASSAVGDKDKTSPVFVWSNDDSRLMLCDVGAETVKYEPPEANNSKALIGKARIRLYDGDEVVLPDSLMGRTEGNDLVENDFSIMLYKKGEFGEVEDCYGDPYAAEDDVEIWNADPFGVYSDPDAIESCWLELDYAYYGE